MCPPCVRGCVRLRTICLPIHLSPNSFVSQVLCQGLCPPPGDWFPNSFISQFICLPGPVSGAVSAPGGFVSQFICPPCVRGCVRFRTICLPIHLSPRSCGRGCVRLRGIGFPIHLSPNSFVRLRGICLPIRLSSIICLPGPVSGAVSAFPRFVSHHLSSIICLPSFVSHHLSPRSCVRGCVRLRGICLPIHLSALCQGLCPPPDDLSPNSFVSQFICLPGPCLPIHLSPRSCGRGCVRLRGIGFPIHLSPNSFVSQVLCQGLCPPSGDLSPNSFVFHHLSPRSCVRGCVRISAICLPSFVFHHLSPIICLPGPVSGAVSASGGFVSQFICLPGPVSGAVSASGGFVSQFICPPCVRGCVRLRTICLPIHLSPRSLSPNSFVSQVLWQGLCPPPGDWFPNSFVSQFICLPGPVSGAVSAFGGFVSQFVCLPSFVSQVLCPGLCPHFRDLSPIICLPSFVSHHLSPRSCVRVVSSQRFICFPIWLVVSSFSAGSNSFVPPRDTSLVSQSGWWCPALWLSPIHLFPACGNSFVSQSGWWCPAFYAVCCLQFICLPLWQLICLPVWLVVSGSLVVSKSFLSPCGNSFVSQSGWWCPAFRLAPIHLSPLVTLHLSPSLAGGVRLSGCLQFICFRLVAIHLSPSLAGGVRLSMLSAVSNSFVFPCGS